MRKIGYVLCATLCGLLSGCEAAKVAFNLGPNLGIELIGDGGGGTTYESHECPCPVSSDEKIQP